MFSKKNTTSKIDPEQRQLIENAQRRARQKKKLYLHFIIFLIGAAVFIVLNVVLDVGINFKPFGTDWFVWAIALWGILLLMHVFNVFVTNKFLGKDWEDRQIERLVAKQEKRINELELKVERDYPLPHPTVPQPKKDKSEDGSTGPNFPYNT
ncbi:MAG TPA: 2TM domain-containing protein [Salinimicrobium sp.]|nr:2TM domain-containing protein [Salinimicrobium sp.]